VKSQFSPIWLMSPMGPGRVKTQKIETRQE
jgi:hypothetical protein